MRVAVFFYLPPRDNAQLPTVRLSDYSIISDYDRCLKESGPENAFKVGYAM